MTEFKKLDGYCLNCEHTHLFKDNSIDHAHTIDRCTSHIAVGEGAKLCDCVKYVNKNQDSATPVSIREEGELIPFGYSVTDLKDYIILRFKYNAKGGEVMLRWRIWKKAFVWDFTMERNYDPLS